MRFINLEDLLPKIEDLLPKLAEAQDRVMAEVDPEERARLIKTYQPRWVALRAAMAEISEGKCWYVECRNDGCDDDVDHFRPKLAVQEDPSHPGYYWLAFAWKNLRLSCHRANRPRIHPETEVTGGKADHFPLLNPDLRARTPSDRWQDEVPVLLDPTNPMDPSLLAFGLDGAVDLAPHCKGNAVAEARFVASRELLHLDWPEFREARLRLFRRVQQLVERGSRGAPVPSYGSPPDEALMDAIRDLREAMSNKSEYSAAARNYIETFRDVWWVREVVLRS
jgi:uncharacterized protein (TIGR02646 family)